MITSVQNVLLKENQLARKRKQNQNQTVEQLDLLLADKDLAAVLVKLVTHDGGME